MASQEEPPDDLSAYSDEPFEYDPNIPPQVGPADLPPNAGRVKLWLPSNEPPEPPPAWDDPGYQAIKGATDARARLTGAALLRLETIEARTLNAGQLDKLPPPEPLLDALLNQNTIAALYGKPGSAKSFVAIDWGLSVATGTWWLGHRVVAGPVLYIAAEGTAGLPQRQRAWQQAHNVILDDSHSIHWLPLAINLLDNEWAAALHAHIALLRPLLIIIDTLARSIPGANENDSAPMSRLVDLADQIRQATGATILLVHHTPKDGGTLRGHSSLEGAIDTGFETTADGLSVTLKCTKQKDMAKNDPIALQLAVVGESCAVYRYGHAAVGDEMGGAEQTIYAVMLESSTAAGYAASALLRMTELKERGFYYALKALINRGLLTNVGTTKTPRYTLSNLAPKEEQF